MFKSRKKQVLRNHILQLWITEQSENYFNFAILQISRVGMQHLIYVFENICAQTFRFDLIVA